MFLKSHTKSGHLVCNGSPVVVQEMSPDYKWSHSCPLTQLLLLPGGERLLQCGFSTATIKRPLYGACRRQAPIFMVRLCCSGKEGEIKSGQLRWS